MNRETSQGSGSLKQTRLDETWFQILWYLLIWKLLLPPLESGLAFVLLHWEDTVEVMFWDFPVWSPEALKLLPGPVGWFALGTRSPV